MTTGTLTTTGREAGTTSVAEAGAEDSLERLAIRDSRGQAPVTSISPAAEATVTEAGARMTGTRGDQDTSLAVAVAEEVVLTTITGETTPGEEEAGEETTEMSRGAVMVMETILMEDTATLHMDMAIPLMGTATHLTDTATPLMDMATLGLAESRTLDLEVEQVAATSTTLGLAWSPTGLVAGEAGLVATVGGLVSSLGRLWVWGPSGALACLASVCSPSEAPLQCSKTNLGPEASGALRRTDT